MTIGIDISQMIYQGTGVGRYVGELTRAVIKRGTAHTFVLFGSSLHKRTIYSNFYLSFTSEERKRIRLVLFPFPPTILDTLWNVFHVFPVEWFVGKIDVFWSSDWTQPPLVHSKGVTTIHDLTPRRFPNTFSKEIISVHERKLRRSIQECNVFLCDSEVTRRDAYAMLHIPLEKLVVVYPGYI